MGSTGGLCPWNYQLSGGGVGGRGVGGGGVRFGRGFAAPRPPNEGYYVFRG